MRQGRRAIVLVAIGLTALLAGCGGGSSDGTGGGGATQVSTEHLAEANALCRQSEQQRVKKLQIANKWVKGGSPGRATKERIVRFVLLAPVEGLAKELRGLGESEGDAMLTRYAEQLQQDVKAAGAKPLIVYSGYAFKGSDRLASKAALSDCTL